MIWFLWVVGTFIAVTVSSGLAGRYGKGWLFAIYAVSIVIANVTASKLMTVFGLTVAAADIIYTIGFTTIDLINEYYGKEEAKRAIVTAFFANVLWAFSAYIAVELPPADLFAEMQPHFAAVIGAAPRIVAASMTAYYIASRSDVFVYHAIRLLGLPVWTRIIGSNGVSLLVDSVVFSTMAFYGIFPLAPVIVGQYITKIVITLINIPFAYLARAVFHWSAQSQPRVPLVPSAPSSWPRKIDRRSNA